MRWIITEPRGVSAALSQPGQAPEPSCLRVISACGRLAPEQRLDVYAEAYFSRLCESLEDDFARVREAVGEDVFRALAAEYLAKYPSRSFTIERVGGFLPKFLSSHELNADLPWLADLASLEWARLECLTAADAESLSLPEGEWTDARVELQPACRLINSEWAIDVEPKDGFFEKAETRLLVRRELFDVRVERVQPEAFAVLTELTRRPTLGELCERLERAQFGELPLSAWFERWALSGVIKITV